MLAYKLLIVKKWDVESYDLSDGTWRDAMTDYVSEVELDPVVEGFPPVSLFVPDGMAPVFKMRVFGRSDREDQQRFYGLGLRDASGNEKMMKWVGPEGDMHEGEEPVVIWN